MLTYFNDKKNNYNVQLFLKIKKQDTDGINYLVFKTKVLEKRPKAIGKIKFVLVFQIFNAKLNYNFIYILIFLYFKKKKMLKN